MSAPPAPLVWPEGLPNRGVPKPDHLMQLDENVKDLGVRVGGGMVELQSWDRYTPPGMDVLWDDYYQKFYWLDSFTVKASYGGTNNHDTHTTLGSLDGAQAFSLASDGAGNVVIIVVNLGTYSTEVISSTDGSTFAERTFESTHGVNPTAKGHVTWTGTSFLFSNGVGGVEVSATGETWADCATQPVSDAYGIQSAVKLSTGTFITAGVGGYSYTTDDGTTWTSVAWANLGGETLLSDAGARAWYDEERDEFLFAGREDSTTPCVFVVNATTLVESDSIYPPIPAGTLGSIGLRAVAMSGKSLLLVAGVYGVAYASGDRGLSVVPVPTIAPDPNTPIVAKFKNRLMVYEASAIQMCAPYLK